MNNQQNQQQYANGEQSELQDKLNQLYLEPVIDLKKANRESLTASSTAMQSVRSDRSERDVWWDAHIEQLRRTLLIQPTDPDRKFRVEDVWRNESKTNDYVILVFLRRFGCPICRAFTSGLAYLNHQVLLADSNPMAGKVKIMAIASESIGAQEFMRLGYAKNTLASSAAVEGNEIQLFVNPNSSAFELLNLKKLSLANVYGVSDVRKTNAALALAADDYYRKTFDFKGNYAQLGGLFVFKLEHTSGGSQGANDDVVAAECVMEFKESFAGDTARVLDILEALQIPRSSDAVKACFKTEDLTNLLVLHLAQRAAMEVRRQDAEAYRLAMEAPKSP